MKNQKAGRIAAFIENLPMDASLGNCESVLLSTNMDMVGAGVNGGDCLNTDQKACESSKNAGDCKNYGGSCDGATNNRACTTEPFKPAPGN